MNIPPRAIIFGLLLAGSTVHAGLPPSSVFALPEPDLQAGLQLPGVDLEKSLAEDRALAGKGVPLRYGLLSSIDTVWIDAGQSQGGSWETLPDGRLLWRLVVSAPEVRSLDFGFSEFRLPAGAELWLVSEDRSTVRGPYTDADNPAPGAPFHTPFVAGETTLIELIVPAHKRDFVRLHLASAARAYRDILQPWAVEKSGSCNVDTVCPEGDAWRNQINSVAQYTFSSGSSSFVCSGQLVNRTSGDRSPIFSTANHCMSTQSEVGSMVLYWKYETATCRAPGSAASGTPISKPANSIQQTGGATLLATNGASDFTLARLNSAPPASASPYWSGWDRSGSTPARSVGIHHPQGDEKRISFDSDAPAAAAYSGDPGSGTTHWRVADWDLGTTEGGSSGSGLWSEQGLLIGQLHGGAAACGNDLPDWYGRWSVSWDGGGTSTSRMSDHLDPGGTGAQTLAGSSSCNAPTVTLSSSAFTGSPRAGDVLTFNAAASGGAGGPYQIDWNIDGGALDRGNGGTSLNVRYPSAISTQVAVTVRDNAGCAATASRALDVTAPDIAVLLSAAATQICGNGDANVDRGERWRIPVTLRNNGGVALGSGAHALFAQGDLAAAALPLGPDSFGHRASTTAQGGCAHSWIDIVSGANATAALALTDDDDGRALVALQGGGFSLYGQSVTQMVMSTNGYLSLAGDDTGEDWTASCSGYDGSGPRLQVLHDDHVVNTGGGLRYRYFSNCPRAGQVGASGQACHVFTWTGLRPFGDSGNAEFQAVLYPATGQAVYQYRTADANNAGAALVGIGNATFSDSLQIGCGQTAAVTAGSAVCLYNPGSLPASNTTAVRLETATRALPALAAGAQTTVNVDLAIPTDATCGAQFAVDYIASADAGSFSKRTSSVYTGALATTCATVTSCPAQIPARTERQGLYYNTGRGGNGVSAFLYGPSGATRTFGGAWFTGSNERLPIWYIIQGSYADNLTRADILRFTNPAAPGGFAPVNTTAGKAWLSFVADDRVMMAWELDDGRDGAELMETLPLASTNRSQAYYNLSQSGWGTVVDTARTPGGTDQEFVVNYLYDAQGNPVWTLGAHTSIAASAHSFSQDTWRVHCPACPQLTDWGTLTLPAGSMSRTWTGSTTGTISTSITLPAPLSGSWNRTNLPIEALGPVQ